MNRSPAFVPKKYEKMIKQYIEKNCHPRRRPGGWSGYVLGEKESSLETVHIQVTEEPRTPGDMRHVYSVPLAEIVGGL